MTWPESASSTRYVSGRGWDASASGWEEAGEAGAEDVSVSFPWLSVFFLERIPAVCPEASSENRRSSVRAVRGGREEGCRTAVARGTAGRMAMAHKKARQRTTLRFFI